MLMTKYDYKLITKNTTRIFCIYTNLPVHKKVKLNRFPTKCKIILNPKTKLNAFIIQLCAELILTCLMR